MQWTGQKIMFDLRREIFRHIQTQDVGFFDKNPVGRLVTRVTSDVDALNEMFTSGVLAIFENVVLLLAIVVIMVRMSWPLALLTLAVIPLIILVTQIFRRSIRSSYRRQRAATAKINSYTQEYVSGMSVVQLFNRERRAFQDFSAVNSENKQAWTDAIFAYSLYYPIVEFLSSFAIALVLWQGGLAIFRHIGVPTPTGIFRGVTLGVLVAFIQYAQRFFRPIMELSDKFNILQAAMAAAERIFKLLDEHPFIVSPAHPITPSPQALDHGRIQFQNVWFTYERLTEDQLHHLRNLDQSGDHAGAPGLASETWVSEIEWILKGVTFDIHPNETAAIVGHTGAGKTTITALMMRFYDIQRRRNPRRRHRHPRTGPEQTPLPFRRRPPGPLPLLRHHRRQHPPRHIARITDQRLEEAADEVNVGDFIRTLLPQAFARTRPRARSRPVHRPEAAHLFRPGPGPFDPGILILDEATSSVDTETEHRVPHSPSPA